MSTSTPPHSLLPVSDALERVLEQCATLPAQTVALADAGGRYLAAPLLAGFDLPPFAGSAMDGYALRAADTPGQLRLVGESAAGVPFDGTVGAGEAITISTGAAVPTGADAVVMHEQTRAGSDGAGSSVEVPDAIAPANCIRPAGSDVKRGTKILPAGTRLSPVQIGAAAALGLGRLCCSSLPRVALLATGSELRPAGDTLGAGQIYNSNGPMLEALARSAGADVTVISTAADTLQGHREALTQALSHDVTISAGGVSVGGHDLVRQVERELGVNELFWRISLKPGKPLSFGTRERPPAGGRSPRTLVFGLPGNPVSVLACFELFVRPALAALQGAAAPRPAFLPAVLTEAVAPNAHRDELIRVTVDGDGRITPMPEQGSHQIAVAAMASGLAWIPAGDGIVPAGACVGYLSLTQR